MSDPNHIPPEGGSQDTPGYFLIHRPDTRIKPVFNLEVSGCDAFMSKERTKDCLRQIAATLKDISFSTSWDIPQDAQE